jgi:hypothetical protein
LILLKHIAVHHETREESRKFSRSSLEQEQANRRNRRLTGPAGFVRILGMYFPLVTSACASLSAILTGSSSIYCLEGGWGTPMRKRESKAEDHQGVPYGMDYLQLQPLLKLQVGHRGAA